MFYRIIWKKKKDLYSSPFEWKDLCFNFGFRRSR